MSQELVAGLFERRSKHRPIESSRRVDDRLPRGKFHLNVCNAGKVEQRIAHVPDAILACHAANPNRLAHGDMSPRINETGFIMNAVYISLVDFV